MNELFSAPQLIHMQRRLHLPLESLLALRTRKLVHTLDHAYSTTPYYRKLFDAAGFHPTDIRSLYDLTNVPISRKEDLMNVLLEDRIAEGTNIQQCISLSTTGSSGTPWEILVSPPEKMRRVLADIRALLANGYSIFDRTCLFIQPKLLPKPGYWFQRLGILRRSFFSLFDDIHTRLTILTKGNYDVIYSFPSDLFLLAEEMLALGTSLTPPKLVVTNGELMGQQWRRTIQEAFGRNPTDFYGSEEFGYIAWQCEERDAYHVNADLFIVELVRDGDAAGPGQEGEVVITDLFPRAMPLIRFATGDWASSSGSPCACGISLPTLSHISGRARDFLVLPMGKKIAPVQVNIQMKNVLGIGSFHVVQVSPSEVVVRYTRRSKVEGDLSQAVLDAFQPLVGEQMQVSVEEVSSIARHGAKFKVIENALLRFQSPP